LVSIFLIVLWEKDTKSFLFYHERLRNSKLFIHKEILDTYSFVYFIKSHHRIEMEMCRIALVDDNSIFCFIFEKLIEKYDKRSIHVMKFDNGQSAFDFFKAQQDRGESLPELVFVDINMPIMNGWQLLDALIKDQHALISDNVPFFIVSSSDNNIDITKAKEYPFIKEYLRKPLDKRKLFAILDQYL